MATQLDADDKINQDGDNNEVKVEITIPNSDALDAIAEQYEASLGVKSEENEPDNNVNGNQQQEVNNQLDAVGLVDDPTKFKVKVKLDGQEQEMPLSDVLAGFQKNEVASRRLNEATRLRQEAEALMQRAQGQLNGGETPSGNNSQDNDNVEDSELAIARDIIGNLLDGNDEEAVKALAKAMRGRGDSTQSVDTTQVAAEVKKQLDVDSALNAFEKSFPEIVSDPYLTELTNQNLRASLAEGKSYEEALNEAGNATRDWMKKLGVQVNSSGNNSTTNTNERASRKQEAEQMPVLSASAANQNEQDESVLDVVNQMRQERGLLT